MDSSRKPAFSRLLLFALGLLTAVALTGCDFYAKKKDGGQPPSQPEAKKDAADTPDAEAGLEEGAPPPPELPSSSTPSPTAPSPSAPPGEGAPQNPASSPSGNPSSGSEISPPASSSESPAPSEGPGQGSAPSKPAPENP